MMVTYQDFLRVPDTDEDRMKFVYACIGYHKDSEAYKTADIAEKYDAHKNVTICEYQKLLYQIQKKMNKLKTSLTYSHNMNSNKMNYLF